MEMQGRRLQQGESFSCFSFFKIASIWHTFVNSQLLQLWDYKITSNASFLLKVSDLIVAEKLCQVSLLKAQEQGNNIK